MVAPLLNLSLSLKLTLIPLVNSFLQPLKRCLPAYSGILESPVTAFLYDSVGVANTAACSALGGLGPQQGLLDVVWPRCGIGARFNDGCKRRRQGNRAM